MGLHYRKRIKDSEKANGGILVPFTEMGKIDKDWIWKTNQNFFFGHVKIENSII